MSINPDFIPQFWLIICWGLFWAFVLISARFAAWHHLKNSRDLNVLLFAILGVVFVWMMQAGLDTTLTLHLLGTTLLTLMFGWRFAILAISLVIIITTFLQNGHWASLPVNSLLLGVLPVLTTQLIYRLTVRYLPANFFVYIFVCAFFAAAVSMASVIFSTAAVHYLSGAFSPDYLAYNYYRYGLLIVFPEAFITGMVLSVFIAYCPQ